VHMCSRPPCAPHSCPTRRSSDLVARMAAGELTATYAVRSSLSSEKAWVCARLERLTALLGGHVTYVGDYPAWEYQKESRLRELRSEEHTSELQSRFDLVCRLLLE